MLEEKLISHLAGTAAVSSSINTSNYSCMQTFSFQLQLLLNAVPILSSLDQCPP
jgi:hypothetical protein